MFKFNLYLIYITIHYYINPHFNFNIYCLVSLGHYITSHGKSVIVVVEDNKQLQKYINLAATCPTVRAFVVWSEPVNETIASKCHAKVYNWEEFMGLGAGVSDEVLDTRVAGMKPGNCSTLIYTSGNIYIIKRWIQLYIHIITICMFHNIYTNM